MNKEELISTGIKYLIEKLGYIEAGEFLNEIAKNTNENEDYTEWRRENLYKGMSDEEIIDEAVSYAKNHDFLSKQAN